MSPGDSCSPLPPIDAAPLIRELDEALLELLRRLKPEAWWQPAVGEWTVHAVAAHLLDGALRRLSLERDAHPPPATSHDLEDFRQLVDFLNSLNAGWVEACRRLSPRVLIDLLAVATPQLADFLESLDPDAEAAFPVAWAGETSSRVWMDVAREFTERWHHQQQIREAVGALGLEDWRYLEPLLETLVRALPRSYASVEARVGTTVLVEIADRGRLRWVLVRTATGWKLGQATAELAAEATIRLPAEAMWRLCTRSIDGRAARGSAVCEGDPRLVDPFFTTLAVMA